MKAFVTGSSGFVARHLVQSLLNEGWSVAGLDLKPDPGAFAGGYSHAVGDIRNASDVRSAIAGADWLIHLAAEHKDFGVTTEQFEDVNVNGMRVLLDEAERTGVNRVFFYSTVAVYGDQSVPTNEELAPSPSSDYGRTKWQAEQILRDWVAGDDNRRAIILRPTVIYGEHNVANMYRLIDSINRGRYLQVGAGANRKSTAYIGNVVAATHHLMAITAAEPVGTYNIADKPDMSSRAIANTIAGGLGRKLPRARLPRGLVVALATPLDWIAAATGKDLPITAARIRKYLTDTIHESNRLSSVGFQWPYAPEDGLRRMVDWYLASNRGSSGASS